MFKNIDIYSTYYYMTIVKVAISFATHCEMALIYIVLTRTGMN